MPDLRRWCGVTTLANIQVDKLIDKPVNFAYGDGSEIYEIALFMTSKWGTRYSKLVYVEELELL